MHLQAELHDLEITLPPSSPEQEKRILTAYFQHLLAAMDSGALAVFRAHLLSRSPMAIENELLARLVESHMAAKREPTTRARSNVLGIFHS